MQVFDRLQAIRNDVLLIHPKFLLLPFQDPRFKPAKKIILCCSSGVLTELTAAKLVNDIELSPQRRGFLRFHIVAL